MDSRNTTQVKLVVSNPARGCSSQPRLAVLGYPGKRGRDGFATLKGLRPTVSAIAAPSRFALDRERHNPVGVVPAETSHPKVAEYDNLGL